MKTTKEKKEKIVELLDASELEIEQYVRAQVREEMMRIIELQYRMDCRAISLAHLRASRFLIASRSRSGSPSGRHVQIAVEKRLFEQRRQKRSSLVYECFVAREMRECLRGRDGMD